MWLSAAKRYTPQTGSTKSTPQNPTKSRARPNRNLSTAGSRERLRIAGARLLEDRTQSHRQVVVAIACDAPFIHAAPAPSPSLVHGQQCLLDGMHGFASDDAGSRLL